MSETILATLARNRFGALVSYPWFVSDLLAAAEKDAGAWTVGIESDRKRRGSSINVDVYSYDSARGLAVVQVRQCVFHPRRFNRIRKDYYLLGRNENGRVFAHPVDSVARSRKALASLEGGVTLALTKIWECDEDDLRGIIRNGDVAFVPETRLPEGAELVESNAVTIRETHHVQGLDGGQIYRVHYSGEGYTYYVVGRARIEHAKHQHPTARVRGGVWRVQEGMRVAVWGFTAPTAD